MSRSREAGPFFGLTPEESRLAAKLAITFLKHAGVSRARWLLSELEPEAAFERLRAGVLPVTSDPPGPIKNQADLIRTWFAEARELQPAAMLRSHMEFKGLTVMDSHHRCWPFVEEPDPPNLLFVLGDPALLVSPSDGQVGGAAVGIVGTRRCSTVGSKVAHQLGLGLARAGVKIVSGLALGIDAAAHHGAGGGSAPRIGVVACGLDTPYPKRNRSLWHEIAETGVLISEGALGTQPDRWRFPARNRLIAALSDVLVVVESHASGGSLLTVDEAALRGVDVLAVPGSVLSSACAGSNQLLMDGCAPVRNAADVLEILGLPEAKASKPDTGAQELPFGDELTERILREVSTGPVHVEVLVQATGESLARILLATQRLAASGVVTLSGSVVDAN